MLEDPLLNHLIRPLQQRRRDRKAEGLNRDVLSLNVPVLTQRLPECIEGAHGTPGQIPDLGHLPRRLRPDGERRGDEAASQGAEERSSVHYQALTWPHRLGGTERGGQQRPYYSRVTCGIDQGTC